MSPHHHNTRSTCLLKSSPSFWVDLGLAPSPKKLPKQKKTHLSRHARAPYDSPRKRDCTTRIKSIVKGFYRENPILRIIPQHSILHPNNKPLSLKERKGFNTLCRLKSRKNSFFLFLPRFFKEEPEEVNLSRLGYGLDQFTWTNNYHQIFKCIRFIS